MKNEITLKPINDLLSFKFLIPDYQRGYRWTNVQVTALLDDIWEFNNKVKTKEEFYCLQPVVVSKRGEEEQEYWELIDGQQRLTTIFIILSYLSKRFTEEFRTPIYTLKYQTREDSESYLSDINEKDREKNIDYHFIYEALITVKEWFKPKQNFINDFESVLINKTKVIWYEVNEPNTNPIDIFTRINIGKIPLTNAELVKALFLQKENFQEDKASLKQLQIASEWDAIEKVLQDDSFWYFIYNPDNPLKYDNRIEYIFDLKKNKKKEHEFYFTYNEFHEDFSKSKEGKEKPDIDAIWLDIKKYFLSFEGWFRDRELYHLIGFLVDCGLSINELKNKSDNTTKTAFKKYLKDEISKQVICQVDELSYGNKYIKKVLLLFNIQTILATKKADIRFPFYKYKDEDWDIEHVRSQTDKQINAITRKDWAKDILEYFTGEIGYTNNEVIGTDKTEKEVQSEVADSLSEDHKLYCHRLIKILDADKIEDETFKKLYDELTVYFQENAVNDKDNISNLALLDAATNRSYKNAMFPIKRKTIIQNDKNGVFIPICTKNLFLKFYSKKMGDVMYWKDSDAKDYLASIKQTLLQYLPLQK